MDRETNPVDEYDKGESVEDIIPYLLPMKCCIRTKFSDIALGPGEWDVSDDRRQPRLFPGLMFLRYPAAYCQPHDTHTPLLTMFQDL